MDAIKSSARRRYVWRVAAAMAGYVVSLMAAELLIDKGGAGGALTYLLAFLPGLCVAAVFWAVARLLIEETDEYLRMLLVRQTLIASGITMVVATVYGFLEMYGLVPRVDSYYVTFAFFIALGIGGVVNKVAYGDGPC